MCSHSWDINIEDKIEVIRVIKNEWQSVDKLNHTFQILMKGVNNESLIEWTWNYIFNRIDNDFELRLSRRISRLSTPTTSQKKFREKDNIKTLNFQIEAEYKKIRCAFISLSI